MKRLAVLDIVGLARSDLGPATPRLSEFAQRGALATITPAFPALTCTAQSDYLTGRRPSDHGIVGNGWYNRAQAEVQFWKQSNHLVKAAKIWDDLRALHPGFTCAKLFWWYNMYSGADFSITPRPIYPADGRKIFDIYTWPFSLRPEIKADLGDFPFPAFWGPAAGVKSPGFAPDAATRWIAESARWIERRYSPTLSLVYLPHLDYNLQRLGPNDPRVAADFGAVDEIVGDLIRFFQERSVKVLLLSEYGIEPVNRPVHLNRLFRDQGWLTIKDELGRELLDCGASRVFAVADHQIAQVYLNDQTLLDEARRLLSQVPGVERVLGAHEKAALGLNHGRAGDLIVEASPGAWFTYYYWKDDALAPDFATTVDIHRKPGYDPVELLLDPTQKLIRLKIMRRLLQKKLGFRMLMDVIPLDATLVRGSHGRAIADPSRHPLLIAEDRALLPKDHFRSTDIYEVLRAALA